MKKNLMTLGLGLMCSFSAVASNQGGLFLEPMLTYEKGDADVDLPNPFGSSHSSIDGFGLGARLGFHVLESVFIGIDGRYSKPNYEMTGFSRQELIGIRPPFPYWPPEEYQTIQKAFEQTLNHHVGHYEMIFMRKSGERFPVIVAPSHIRDNNNNIISYTASVKDIALYSRPFAHSLELLVGQY